MTREVLDSDVEYGRRLLSEGRSDEAIVKALGLRGVDALKAGSLVKDLRSGERIRSKMILVSKRTGQRNEPG